jgi:hypothetical protein
MFDLASIPDGSTVFVVSSDPVQTTRVIEQIVQSKSEIVRVVRFSKEVPASPVRVLSEILSPQSTLFIERHTYPERDRRMIAVFDTCFTNESWNTDHCMHTFFTAGRTLAITSLFGVSNLDRLPPGRAAGIDILFIAAPDRALYDRFVNYRCTYEEFCTAAAGGFVVVRLDVLDIQVYHLEC